MTLYEDRVPFIAHDVEKASYVGEAILDENMNQSVPGLEELVGLSHDEWSIVGIHTTPANSYDNEGYVTVLAVDLSKLDDEYNRPGGLVGVEQVEVVQFETSLTFKDIMSTMKRSSIFYKAKGLKDTKFYVSEERELPEQN